MLQKEVIQLDSILHVSALYYNTVVLDIAAKEAGISTIQARRLTEFLTAGTIESLPISLFRGKPYSEMIVYTARASPEELISQQAKSFQTMADALGE